MSKQKVFRFLVESKNGVVNVLLSIGENKKEAQAKLEKHLEKGAVIKGSELAKNFKVE